MKQLLRSIGFILILYSVAPNIIHEMTLAQKIMFVLGASLLVHEGGRKGYRSLGLLLKIIFWVRLGRLILSMKP